MDGLDRDEHSNILDALLDCWGVSESSSGELPAEVDAARVLNDERKLRIGLIGPTKGRFGAVTLACYRLIETCGFDVEELNANVFEYHCNSLSDDFDAIVVLPVSSGSLGKYMQIFVDAYDANEGLATLRGQTQIISLVPTFDHTSNFVRDQLLQRYGCGPVKTLKTISPEGLDVKDGRGAQSKPFFEKYFGALPSQLAPLLYQRCVMSSKHLRVDRDSLKQSVATSDTDAKRKANMRNEDAGSLHVEHHGQGPINVQNVVASDQSEVQIGAVSITSKIEQALAEAARGSFEQLESLLGSDEEVLEEDKLLLQQATRDQLQSHDFSSVTTGKLRGLATKATAALAASTVGSAVATAILETI